MKPIYRYFALILLFTSVSCGTTKKLLGIKEKEKEKERKEAVVVASEEKENKITDKRSRENEKETRSTSGTTYVDKIDFYINSFVKIAQEEMKLYKIPASITLAQGILESGAGEGELTRKANNHFGIKCHGWQGGKVYHDDDRSQECFRKYNDAKYSFRDHSLFLTERKRYAFLFELKPDDYKGWAKGLRTAGYATDRKYPDKLIDIIERYQLYRYDAEVLGKEEIAYEENDMGLPQTHVVSKGETLYSISKRYNLTVEQLKQLNNLSDSTLSIGQLLYVSPLTTNL